MTEQTMNSIDLYKGGNPDTIERLMRLQSRSVIDEMRKELKATGIRDLAVKLSLM